MTFKREVANYNIRRSFFRKDTRRNEPSGPVMSSSELLKPFPSVSQVTRRLTLHAVHRSMYPSYASIDRFIVDNLNPSHVGSGFLGNTYTSEVSVGSAVPSIGAVDLDMGTCVGHDQLSRGRQRDYTW